MSFWYGAALFVHLLGLISLFGGLMITQRAGARLRGSPTWDDARVWLAFLRQVRGMFLGGSLMLLASGLFMTWRQWPWNTPWVVVGEAVVVLFTIGGAMLGRGFAGIGRYAAERDGAIDPSDRTVLGAPQVWAPMFAMNGGALGVVWIMATKPGWWISVGVPLALTIAGAIAGAAMASRYRQAPVSRPVAAPAPPPPSAGRSRPPAGAARARNGRRGPRSAGAG